MKLKVWVATGLLLLSMSALAQEKPPEMSAEEKKMMEAWMKYMTPSEGHKLLDGMVGTWETKNTFWQAPGAPPMESSGVSENRWIMGGRVLEQKFEGNFMNMPFSGVGYTGYDNAKKQYWGTWIDNMSTGLMTSTGNTSDGGKTWKFKATSTDPMTGKDSPAEEVIKVVSNDHHVFEMWGPAPDGKMFKMMVIDYKRKK